MTLDIHYDEGTSELKSRELSEFARITNQDFNNYRRRHLKNASCLGSSCLDSLEEHGKSIEAGNCTIILKELNFSQSRNHTDFFFAFYTK